MNPTDPLKDQIRSTWDAGAGGYDATPRHGMRFDDEWAAWRRLVAAILGDALHSEVRPLRVLDVGTGTGHLALLAAELGHEVIAVDLSEGMLAQAKTKARARGRSIEWRVGDAEDPPVSPGGFDAVVTRHLVWTLPNPDRAFAAWRSVLRPGGLVAVIDGVVARRNPIASLAAGIARRLVRRRTSHDEADHAYEPDLYVAFPFRRQTDTRQVVRALTDAGFEHVRVRRLPEIDRAERAHLDPLARLADDWRAYLASGRTPAG